MNKIDSILFAILSLLAIMIWTRDTNWMTSPDDTLPILAAIPIFIWLGAPWNVRERPFPLSIKQIAIAIACILFGIITNITFFLALGWTLLLYAWIASAIQPEPGRVSNKLFVIPLLAFPWISLDFDKIGWWFRLTGSWATGKIFSLTGYNVHQEGTNILINNLFVNVEVACAGLNILQSMLIAGVVVNYILLKNSTYFWVNLAVLPILAWISNTVRIIFVSIAALFASPAFATGAFHQVGGWFIIILMFCLCWAIFTLEQRHSEKSS